MSELDAYSYHEYHYDIPVCPLRPIEKQDIPFLSSLIVRLPTSFVLDAIVLEAAITQQVV